MSDQEYIDSWSKPSRHPIACTPGEMLPCNVHRYVGSKGPKYKYGKLSPPVLRRLSDDKPLGSCTCDYVPYPQLYDERIDAKPVEKTFPLFELPAEIREQIYRYVVVDSDPIEFCPEPWTFTGESPAGQNARDDLSEKWRERAKSLSKCVSQAHKLFRVSKQVHDEVAPIFFANNIFRFTNSCGWIGLTSFMSHIGPAHCQDLRSVTVCHPSYHVRPVSRMAADTFKLGILGFHGRSLFKRKIGDDRLSDFAPFADGFMSVINLAPRLRTLQFVVPDVGPDSLPTLIQEATPFCNDPRVFAQLEVSWLLLKPKSEPKPEEGRFHWRTVAAIRQMEALTSPVVLAKKYGRKHSAPEAQSPLRWPCKKAAFDDEGHYGAGEDASEYLERPPIANLE